MRCRHCALARSSQCPMHEAGECSLASLHEKPEDGAMPDLIDRQSSLVIIGEFRRFHGVQATNISRSAG